MRIISIMVLIIDTDRLYESNVNKFECATNKIVYNTIECRLHITFYPCFNYNNTNGNVISFMC